MTAKPGTGDLGRAPSLTLFPSPVGSVTRLLCLLQRGRNREQTVHSPQFIVASARGTSYLPTKPQYPPACRSNDSTWADDGPQPARTVSISGLYPGGAMLRAMSRSGHHRTSGPSLCHGNRHFAEPLDRATWCPLSVHTSSNAATPTSNTKLPVLSAKPFALLA